jgi:hypothetical protein
LTVPRGRRPGATLDAPIALAGIVATLVMGSVIQTAAVPLEGDMTGFSINAMILIISGTLGLLLLWPNTERARFAGQAAHPEFI